MKTPTFWQNHTWKSQLLKPLSAIYRYISLRNQIKKERKVRKLPVPVIVIGNINVGGTGKTPTTIALVNAFQNRGLQVGVLTRGYKRKNNQLIIASSRSTVEELGDEPYLIYQKTNAPLAVFPDRYKAGLQLLKQHPQIDVIICDDGLQHYQLFRDIEIAVVGKQGFGNKLLFPAGPLREPISRLHKVDYIINNGFDTQTLATITHKAIINLEYEINMAFSLLNQQKKHLDEFHDKIIYAIAGIAYPEHFFSMLKEKGISIIPHYFPDHHIFQESSFDSIGRPCFMTEKDAVKCQSFNLEDTWCVPLETQLNQQFIDNLIKNIKSIKNNN